MAVSVAAGLLGIGIAFLFYVASPGLADRVAGMAGGLYKLVYNKYFIDEIYDTTVVRPLIGGSRALLWRTIDAGRRHYWRQ